jgi:hypothetical protein
MSDKRARYTGGSQTGVDVTIEFDNGEQRRAHIKQGGELPTVIDGLKVPAAFRDSLLEQTDNWSEVKRATGAEATGKTTTATAGKDGE